MKKSFKINSKFLAIFGVAIMLLSLPIALPVDAQANTVQMGGMPTGTGSGTSGW